MTTISKYNGFHLQCRAMSHQWILDAVGPVEDDGGTVWLRWESKCVGCGTKKCVTLARDGAIVQRRYVYEPEYKLDKAVTRQDLRQEFVRRTFKTTLKPSKKQVA